MSLSERVASLLLALIADLPDASLQPAAWYELHQDHPLELSSLQVIQLVDLIEATCEITLTSADVVRAHFASPAALVRRLQLRGAT